MPVITQSGATRTVVVSKPVPVRTVEQQLETLEVQAHTASQPVAEKQTQATIEVGRQGPPGPPGPPSTFSGTTDNVPEGTVNLYYTDARAAAAAPVQSVNGQTGTVSLDADDVQADPVGTALAAAASAITIHRLDTDPHPGAVIDGGNF